MAPWRPHPPGEEVATDRAEDDYVSAANPWLLGVRSPTRMIASAALR